MLLAGVMSLLIILLNRGYISQLANNLRSGVLKSDEIEIKDKTTQGTVALTQTSLERDRLLQQISRYRSKDVSLEVRPAEKQATVSAPKSVSAGTDENLIVEVIRDLLSRDENRIRRVLVNKTITPVLLPHILPLFRNQGVLLQEALKAAKPLVSTASGQLVDALLDQRQHPLIRRRIPLLLGQADNELALRGLTLGLQDRELDVRFRCAEALARIKTNHPHLPIDTEAVWRVVYREVAHFSASGFESFQGVEPLRYLFSLLGIIFGPSVMDICYESLHAEDPATRGTALEYLENQLPQNVRTPLWPLIASGRPETKSNRSLEEIMHDLLEAGRTVSGKEQILESRMKDLKEPD
jgi:hypothetical protein